MIDIKDGLLQIFNVDHGACALLSMPGNRRILIDCGHSADLNGKPWYPGAHLANLGVSFIDLLICTNYDEDHASGVPSLVDQNIAVGSILGNPTVPPEAIAYLKSEDGMGNGIAVLVNSLTDRQQRGVAQVVPEIPNVQLSYFWNPWPHWDSENNLSLVTCLSVYGWNFLFPGDMERDGFENMLKFEPFSRLMPRIDVLMASHHGRENGKCPAMFDIHHCSPELIVISDCAKRHQSQETTQYYSQKARGLPNFREQGPRFVLTTRSDKEIHFLFESGTCRAL